MAGLGLGAYRLLGGLAADAARRAAAASTSAGLDFYRRLVDALLRAWHRARASPSTTGTCRRRWRTRGGWRNRDTADRFADYAATVHDALGDGVPYWITLNEPYCSAIVGYAEGRHAPGAGRDTARLAAAHHLLARPRPGRRPPAGRAREGEQVGVTLNMSPAVPASASAEDAAAARRMDLLVNRQFTEPLLGGAYPEDLPEVYGRDQPTSPSAATATWNSSRRRWTSSG